MKKVSCKTNAVLFFSMSAKLTQTIHLRSFNSKVWFLRIKKRDQGKFHLEKPTLFLIKISFARENSAKSKINNLLSSFWKTTKWTPELRKHFTGEKKLTRFPLHSKKDISGCSPDNKAWMADSPLYPRFNSSHASISLRINSAWKLIPAYMHQHGEPGHTGLRRWFIQSNL